MNIDEYLIERVVEATVNGIAVMDPINGIGMGVVLGIYVGWVTRSMTIYLFKRTERTGGN